MNLLLDIQILASLLLGLGVLELLPCLVALAHGEASLPYFEAAAVAIVFGMPLAFAVRPSDRRMHPRDGFVVVACSWLMVSVFGALPYILTGTLAPADALFESASGFTTTGSTVLVHIEGTAHGILFWRSLTQWLGGMGIIVLTIAVLPFLGIGGMQLFQAEVPGPVADKLTPRIAETARRLWFVYVGLTAAAALAYFAAGMNLFEAVCHAFTTLATGGFSTRNDSIAGFGSPLIEWITIVFMLAGGMNFVLHYKLMTGRVREVLRNEELAFYGCAVLLLSAGIAWVIRDMGGAEQVARTASFQVVSLLTTTGFASSDYERWHGLSHVTIILLLMTGGMAGSTSGGAKTMRWIIGLRALRRMVALLPHRSGIRVVRFAGRPVDDGVVTAVLVYFGAYFLLAFLAAMIVATAHYDLETALSAGMSVVGNIGPGLGEIGPTDTFAHFPSYVKLSLAACMIAGRLEIFTVLALLDREFWRH